MLLLQFKTYNSSAGIQGASTDPWRGAGSHHLHSPAASGGRRAKRPEKLPRLIVEHNMVQYKCNEFLIPFNSIQTQAYPCLAIFILMLRST